jgi:hypothetical protein
LLSVLVHFFEHGRWESPVKTAGEGQSLTAEDQLFILMQAGLYLAATRGLGAPEARICYERAEPLSHQLGHPFLFCAALVGQWRNTLITDKMSVALQIAERLHSVAQEQNDAVFMLEAYRALSCTLFYLGDFEASRQYAMRSLQIWRSGNVQCHTEDNYPPGVACLCCLTLSDWQLGEIASCQANMEEAISIAKELKHMNGLAMALAWAAVLGQCGRNPAEVDRLASDLIELSTRHNFGYWLAFGAILRGWARSASGDTVEGIQWIENGIRDSRATGSLVTLPYYLGLKAEALYLADRSFEALEAIKEAEKVVERSEQRQWCAELHRLRGVFLTATGAEKTQIDASFCEAIRIAKEQKSISLAARAEATYAEYRRQKVSAVGGRGFRLSLCCWQKGNAQTQV